MAEQITYTNSGGTALRLDVTGSLKYLRGDNVDPWQIEASWEQAYDTAVLRGYGAARREFGLRFAVTASSYDNARGTIAAIRRHLAYDIARDAAGTLQVVTGGGTYTVRAAPISPEINGPDNTYADVTLRFQADSGWWNYGAASAGTAQFAGTAPVELGYSLPKSDYKVWPAYSITGVIGTATLAERGYSIVLGTVTANADDVVTVATNPPEVRYYEHGAGSGVACTGIAGTLSTFFELLPPSGTITLTDPSGGTALITMTYQERVGGLGA
jgi:hypothetical protein